MTLHVLLAIAFAAGPAAGQNLCDSTASQIEPDMRIHESDLDQSAASAAAEKLKDMIDRGDLVGEFHFGALNQIKIIQGHMLHQQANSDRQEFGQDSVQAKKSTMALCNWLGEEGFWYD